MSLLFQRLVYNLPNVVLALTMRRLTSSSIRYALSQCTAKVGEAVHYVEVLAVDGDIGFGLNIGFSRGRLMQNFIILSNDSKTKLKVNDGVCHDHDFNLSLMGLNIFHLYGT